MRSKATCSCGAHPANHCVCEKAAEENVTPAASDACPCGKREKHSCTCGADAHCHGEREGEIDFTNLK